MKINVLNTQGKKTDKVFELNEQIFDCQMHQSILRQAIHVHLTNTRTGTAKTKDRREVAGTGKKPWKNNKMGRARTGDLRTPIYRGGGVSHGPVPMNYALAFPKKLRQTALYLALTGTVKAGKFYVIEDVTVTEKPSTKEIVSILSALKSEAEIKGKRVTVYATNRDELLVKSFRNIPYVRLMDVNHMNPFDLIASSDVIVTESAMTKLNKTESIVAGEQEVEKKKTVRKTTKKEISESL